MVKLQTLEELRTRKEVKDYFKQLGKEITEEEIDKLKASYEQAEQNNDNLTLEQLNEVAGGVIECFISEGRISAIPSSADKLNGHLLPGTVQGEVHGLDVNYELKISSTEGNMTLTVNGAVLAEKIDGKHTEQVLIGGLDHLISSQTEYVACLHGNDTLYIEEKDHYFSPMQTYGKDPNGTSTPEDTPKPGCSNRGCSSALKWTVFGIGVVVFGELLWYIEAKTQEN